MDQPIDDNANLDTNPPAPVATARKQYRGFARLSVDRMREIASSGGKEAHRVGRAHRFSSETARSAGQKGGQSVSRDREYMRAIGRKGGCRRHALAALRRSSLPSDG